MKRALLLTVAVILCTADSALADWVTEVTGANPLHWHRFEELTGPNAADLGSAGVTAAYSNVALDNLGRFSKAVYFDGTGNDSSVNIGQPALTGDWTAEFIAKAVHGGASHLLSFGDGVGDVSQIELSGGFLQVSSRVETRGITRCGSTGQTTTCSWAPVPR